MRRRSIGCTLGIAALLLTVLAVPVVGDRPAPSRLALQPGVASATWGEPVILSSSFGDVSGLQVAVDALGNAVVAWEQSLTNPPVWEAIRASRYAPGAGWNLPSVITSAADVSDLSVTMIPDGTPARDAETHREYDAIAVWRQGTAIFASRGSGDGWWPPEVVDENTGLDPYAEYYPDTVVRAAMDAAGNALVVWDAIPLEGGRRPFVRYLSAEAGWEPSTTLAYAGWNPQIAMTPTGNALAVWVSRDVNGTSQEISARGFIPGVGWGEATLIRAVPQYWSAGLQLALSADGSAFAVWAELFDFKNWQTFGSYFAPRTGWGPPQPIGTGNSIQVAMDANGNAIALWNSWNATTLSPETYASYFTPTGAWEAPTSIGEWGDPQIAMSAGGTAIVVGGRLARLFRPGTGWGPTELTGIGSSAYGVAMDADGDAIVVGPGSDETGYGVLARRRGFTGGWGTTTMLMPAAAWSDASPQVGVDMKGDALAVWQQGRLILARSFVLGQWSSETWVVGAGQDPRVAVSPSGYAVVVWNQAGQVLARGWTRESGWSAIEAVGRGHLPRGQPLAIDSEGLAVVVWIEAVGESANLYVRRLPSPEPPELLDTLANSAQPTWVSAAAGGRGSVIVAWRRDDGTSLSILSARFVPTMGWGQTEDIDAGPGNASRPRLAMDVDGNAIAIWWQWGEELADAGWNLYARRFDTAMGWRPVERLGAYPSEWFSEGQIGPFDTSESPDVAINAAGLAVATWPIGAMSFARWFAPESGWMPARALPGGGSADVELDSMGNALLARSSSSAGISATHFTAARGWGPAQHISAGQGGISFGPNIGMDGMGNVVIIWIEYGGSVGHYLIYASRFVRTLVPDLIITDPMRTLTNSPSVTVAGLTNPGVSVAIDGTAVPVDMKGSFSLATDRADGTHTFEIIATSYEGFATRATVAVTVDTEPPLLSLASPVDGLAVETPMVTLAGLTEPGADIVVNGVVASVAPDGSFSIGVALREGINIIEVTATDAAGNTAMRDVTVTYANPLEREIAFVRSVAIGAVIAVVMLVATVSFLRLTARKGKPWARQGSAPAGPSSGLNAEKRWPSQAVVAGPLRLIAKERILLHLLHYARYADVPEVPPEMTQERIAEAAGIDHRHFAQYTRPLLQERLLAGRSGHVRGSLQRRKVYFLTDEGRRKALEIRDRLRSLSVRMRDASGERVVTIAEALLEARGSMSILDILRESIETGVVDIRH